MTEDEQAIRDAVAEFLRASLAGDTDAVLALIADDAVFQTCGTEPFGKDAFEQSATAQTAKVDGRTDILELELAGDWAWTRQHLRIEITPPAGEPMVREGYGLTIFRKGADGRWLLARDANLLPPPKPPS